MLKKILFIFALAFCLGMTAGCIHGDAEASGNSEDIPVIVATLFPQYDFARQIIGDKNELVLLLAPGMDSHSYDPTPVDMLKIRRADLFIYTGALEPWAARILSSLEEDGPVVLDLSQSVFGEALPAGSGHHDHGTHDHDHEHDHSHNLGEIEYDPYDPHIWTDPQMAQLMVTDMIQAICSLDPAHADFYQANGAAYLAKLADLDARFQAAAEEGQRKSLVFGGRFALSHFCHRYGFEAWAAYDSCIAESEPSVKRIMELSNFILEEQIPVIYYEELSEPKIAHSISEATGARPLLFHSCHNLTKDEFENGVTYLTLMEQNLENLKEGLR